MRTKMKATFSSHALTSGSYVSSYFDLYSLTSSCWVSASLIGEAVVHNVEVMLSNVNNVDKRLDYQAWQTLEDQLNALDLLRR